MWNKKTIPVAIATILVCLIGAIVSWETRPSKGQTYADCTQDAHIVAQYEHDGLSDTVEVLDGSSEINAKSEEYTRKKYLQQTVTCKSLRSQWATADTTHYAFSTGILGLLLIALTLWITWLGVRNAREASRAETRGYLMLDHMKVLTTSVGGDLNFVVVGHNYGNTPVSKARAEIYFLLSYPKSPERTEIQRGGSFSTNRVPQGGTIEIPVTMTGRTIVGDVLEKIATVTLCVEFTYYDIYKVKTIDPFQFDLFYNGEHWNFRESNKPDIRHHSATQN